MKRFEFSEGTSNKFWEVETQGKDLRVRFGKLGSDGQLKLKTLASPAAAEAEMQKLIAEKTKKGYTPVGGEKHGTTAAAGASNGHAATGNVKPTALAVKAVQHNMGTLHRIALGDHRVVATGDRCFASSDGKKFHRRESPGTSYALVLIDGALYTSGGPFMVSKDWGASWKNIKTPYNGYHFAICRDSKGTWWVGCDEGVVLTSSHPERGWKQAPFKTPGKVLHIADIDGRLFIMGAGSGTSDGKKFTAAKGLKKTDVITRITESPNGVLICHGDGGCAFRSLDRGKSWKAVKSGVKEDLEDSAWVAGALFVVGGGGTLLRSTNDGQSFQKVKTDTQYKIWSIASWGDGAFLGSDDGTMRSLSAPTDHYWRGCKDEFVPPPITVDGAFQPLSAIAKETREKQYAKLHAEAVEAHDKLSAKLREARPKDANPKLAQQVEDGGDDAMQVYADWLSDQGDPRGELAQIQIRLAGDPKNKELKKAEKALFKKHSEAFLGKLTDLEDVLELEWRAGFIYKARLFNTYDREGMYGDEDENRKPPVDIEKLLGDLLDLPSARFLRELVVGIVEFEDNDYSGVAKVIGKRYLPALRTLFLGDFHSEETELNWSSLGHLEPMYAALPNLTSLKLRSGSMKLGTIVLPSLETFEVITGGLDHKAAKAIAAAKWPGLKSLTIQIGSENYEGDANLKDLQPILDGVGLPRLEHLGLTNNELTDKLIAPLAASKIVPQLTGLSLEMGTMGDEGAATMFRLQRAFAHLSSINVDDNFITKAGKKLLTDAKLAFEFGKQRDDGGDPEDRYCSAAE